jgi:hypothetical protein
MNLSDNMDYEAVSSANSSIVYPVSGDVPHPSASENGTDNEMLEPDDDMLAESPRSTSEQTQASLLRAGWEDGDGAQAINHGKPVVESGSLASESRLCSSRDEDEVDDDEEWATPTETPVMNSPPHGRDLYDQTESNDSIAEVEDLSKRLRFEVRIPEMPADQKEQYQDLDSGVVGVITEKKVLDGGSIEYRVEFTDGRDSMVRRAHILLDSLRSLPVARCCFDQIAHHCTSPASLTYTRHTSFKCSPSLLHQSHRLSHLSPLHHYFLEE